MAGEGGKTRLEQMLLRHLPSSTQAVSLDTAVQRAREVLSCDLFRYASSDAQGTLKGGCGLLFQMQNGLPLSLPNSPTKFMQTVWAVLPNFLRLEPDANSRGSSASGDAAP